jgi:chloramphenicol-sensitive protein RarD
MKDRSEYIRGLIFAVLAFFTWGVLAVYWKLLKQVPPLEILSHRIWWAFVFLMFLLLFQKRLSVRKLLKNRKVFFTLLITALLIGGNWFTYIFAVNSNRIIETSMGYYINPIVSVFLGLIVLDEKLTTLQWVALGLASIGVLYMAFDYGKFPWIALILAFSFGFYGLFKKKAQLPSMLSLFVETIILAPFALAYIIRGEILGTGALFSISPLTDLLLIGAGVVTSLPLYWFARGAKRIPLSTVGFIQYLGPTLMLLIGVFLYGEPFTRAHAISFSLIWAALILYSISLIKKTIPQV